MVQQWLSATADLGATKATPQPHHTAASSVTATPPKPLETPKERPAAIAEPTRAVVDEQHQYVEKLERALQRMADELPAPQVDAASRSKEPAESVPDVDSRRLLEEPAKGVHPREEGGLETALQTLANMPRPRLMPFGAAAPPATEPGLEKAEDAAKQPRKLGVVRVA
jgi:hypothetical protein